MVVLLIAQPRPAVCKFGDNRDWARNRYQLLALSGHPSRAQQCPLLGVKRTSTSANPMSAFDPKRTSPLL